MVISVESTSKEHGEYLLKIVNRNNGFRIFYEKIRLFLGPFSYEQHGRGGYPIQSIVPID